ncbi:hypothetical protein ACFPAF_12970 [Hymenobacter endophyticus]|uniref:Uncharacterized protein n=1 Tax=Hymenobacter endophyticus TaxID=3076335 RepID=A0ABU3TIW9_9BACT|nr:hypothetical protein [Hymenobacter endophyticus]MDU0371313.1 hypothetical protein [Hymenobacter endophyticus]
MSYYFALFLALFKIHTIIPDFRPTGKIVVLSYKNAVFHTDTTALMSMYHEHGDDTTYALHVAQLIRRRVRESKNDTVSFSGNLVPFDNNDAGKGDWAISWVVNHLVEQNRVIVLDKRGLPVKSIKVKVVGYKGWNKKLIKISYVDKATNEELFSKGIYLERWEPVWR